MGGQVSEVRGLQCRGLSVLELEGCMIGVGGGGVLKAIPTRQFWCDRL